jgi:hypothetical protein
MFAPNDINKGKDKNIEIKEGILKKGDLEGCVRECLHIFLQMEEFGRYARENRKPSFYTANKTRIKVAQA